MEKQKCQICNSEMSKIEQKIIAGTTYEILKCAKCKHTVAKSFIV